ncbi:LacI family DNA-binding transcriptional regulator [Vallitalea pronyensis]|uniref:LacI family DNA-binding transcriptional regulator n=1 Tax=Vallitalea pronyensis TaxID=1348613 RepID=A0A8J8SHT0_9FIRM|nr:LacI family DNA-binding transcriptional regulator [Vallitalea pronyensis]QUI23744.1 LacI family DNA-binding transcriptional regulator [Vallitalea pronyensis]
MINLRKCENMIPTKKVTIYDVAETTGLSIATISRVLNNKGGYSEKTKTRVLDACNKLGFVPNNTAINLASKKTKTIGLSLTTNDYYDNIEDTYTLRFLKGAISSAARYGYDILIESHIASDDSQKQLKLPQKYDGAVFPHLSNSNIQYVEFLLKSGFPTVYAGSLLPDDPKHHNIYAGYKEYKRTVLDMLLESGHKNIIVLENYSYSLGNTNVPLLQEVIKAFIYDNNLPYTACQLVLYDITMPNHLTKQLSNILSSPNRPDAIYAPSTASANMVYTIINKMGYHIPKDISVIGTVHSPNDGESFLPPLSTVFIDAYEMGKDAAKLIIHYIEENDEHPIQKIAYEIKQRESIQNRNE